MKGVFITGTDTGVGKTQVTRAWLAALRADGMPALAMKPVASGCDDTPEGLRNDDALRLIAAMGADAPRYDEINPLALREPIAPHLAARREGVTIDIDAIVRAAQALAARAPCVLVEGVGGWAVPLGESIMQADLARALGLPVVLVVGLRLGCINHALLSARAIVADGLHLAGWIANAITPDMPVADDNVDAIARRIGAPCLARLPHGEQPDAAMRWARPVMQSLLADARA